MIFRHVGDMIRKRPRKYISPFQIVGCRPRVPIERALAMRNKIASNENMQQMTLIDSGSLVSYDGSDLLNTFADDDNASSSLIDYIVHCLRYDDIVHKQDSHGYRVFLSTGLWTAAKDVHQEYMDDGITETEPFRVMREHLEVQLENYDVTKAKLVFIPEYNERHYFVYCLNLIHNRIDILDTIDYWFTDTDSDVYHKPIFEKLPIINAAFHKVTSGKFPKFLNWSRPFAGVPKQIGPNDCISFLWKYMEFWDGDTLRTDLNPYKGMIYRIEMMHYAVFHSLNQADLPEELDIYRLGGRKIDFDQSQ
ncbi:unnamed protein product [Urochloa humidicola]